MSGIHKERLKRLSTKGLSNAQLSAGEDRHIYHGINLARDVIHIANSRKEGAAIADCDIKATFDLMCMRWVCLVLLAKDMTQNLNCFKDLYKDVDTTVVVNIQLGR